VGPSFGFLTTRPDPRHAGDTYSEVMAGHLATAGAHSVVVTVGTGRDARPGAVGVGCAGDALAMLAGADVVVVDHEVRGDDDLDRTVAEVAERTPAPVIVVAHRLPHAAGRAQRQMLVRIGAAAQALVAPSAVAAGRVATAYQVARGNVSVISDELRGPARSAARGDSAAPTVVTYGPVGPGRGLEAVIDTMAALRSLAPRPRYRIVGPTDPAVLAHDGEAYRHALMARTIERGVADMVRVVQPGRPAGEEPGTPPDLLLVARTCPRQVTSREVVKALADGTPVVAVTTADTAGMAVAAGIDRIVRAGDAAALILVLRRLLTDVDLLTAAAERDRYGRRRAWARIATQYQDLAAALLTMRRQPAA
jgi:polysaccharide biosynthesis protein PslF